MLRSDGRDGLWCIHCRVLVIIETYISLDTLQNHAVWSEDRALIFSIYSPSTVMESEGQA